MLRPQPDVKRPGQESVWDYPRPPRLEPVAKLLRVEFAGQVLATSNECYRVLETSHPPVYYFPPGDVRLDLLVASPGNASNCEWKGQAKYFDAVVEGRRAAQVAWAYADPVPAFATRACSRRTPRERATKAWWLACSVLGTRVDASIVATVASGVGMCLGSITKRSPIDISRPIKRRFH